MFTQKYEGEAQKKQREKAIKAQMGSFGSFGETPWLLRWLRGEKIDKKEFHNQFGAWEICGYCLLAYYFFGGIYYVAQREEMNHPDLIYFFTVTMTTVGFGDISPLTQQSRVVMIFFACFGNIVLGMCFSQFSEMVMAIREEKMFRTQKAVIQVSLGHGTKEEQMRALHDLHEDQILAEAQLKRDLRARQIPLPSPEDLIAAFEAADVDKNGMVDEEEFLSLLQSIKKGKVAGISDEGLTAIASNMGRHVYSWARDTINSGEDDTKLTKEEVAIAKRQFAHAWAESHDAAIYKLSSKTMIDKETFKILMLTVIDEANKTKIRAKERAQRPAMKSKPSLMDIDPAVARIVRHHKNAVAAAQARYAGKRTKMEADIDKNSQVHWQPLLHILFAITAYVLTTGFVYMQLEGWNYVDSCYFSVIAATTVGYGDFYPTTRLGKWLAVPLLPMAVVFVNLQLGSIGEVLVNASIHNDIHRILNVDLSLENLLEMDDDGDGSVDEYEFLMYVLTQTGLCDRDTIENLHNCFQQLDADGSGAITADDFRNEPICNKVDLSDIEGNADNADDGTITAQQIQDVSRVWLRRQEAVEADISTVCQAMVRAMTDDGEAAEKSRRRSLRLERMQSESEAMRRWSKLHSSSTGDEEAEHHTAHRIARRESTSSDVTHGKVTSKRKKRRGKKTELVTEGSRVSVKMEKRRMESVAGTSTRRTFTETKTVGGLVRFVGETDFAPGLWVGCELDEPEGKNDGSVQGKYYFHCGIDFGIFVRPDAIRLPDGRTARLLTNGEESEEDNLDNEDDNLEDGTWEVVEKNGELFQQRRLSVTKENENKNTEDKSRDESTTTASQSTCSSVDPDDTSGKSSARESNSSVDPKEEYERHPGDEPEHFCAEGNTARIFVSFHPDEGKLIARELKLRLQDTNWWKQRVQEAAVMAQSSPMQNDREIHSNPDTRISRNSRSSSSIVDMDNKKNGNSNEANNKAAETSSNIDETALRPQIFLSDGCYTARRVQREAAVATMAVVVLTPSYGRPLSGRRFKDALDTEQERSVLLAMRKPLFLIYASDEDDDRLVGRTPSESSHAFWPQAPLPQNNSSELGDEGNQQAMPPLVVSKITYKLRQLLPGPIQGPLTANDIGAKVCAYTVNGEMIGVARFLGTVDFSHGEFVGIELDEGLIGKNDGSYGGKRYFYLECDRNKKSSETDSTPKIRKKEDSDKIVNEPQKQQLRGLFARVHAVERLAGRQSIVDKAMQRSLERLHEECSGNLFEVFAILGESPKLALRDKPLPDAATFAARYAEGFYENMFDLWQRAGSAVRAAQRLKDYLAIPSLEQRQQEVAIASQRAAAALMQKTHRRKKGNRVRILEQLYEECEGDLWTIFAVLGEKPSIALRDPPKDAKSFALRYCAGGYSTLKGLCLATRSSLTIERIRPRLNLSKDERKAYDKSMAEEAAVRLVQAHAHWKMVHTRSSRALLQRQHAATKLQSHGRKFWARHEVKQRRNRKGASEAMKAEIAEQAKHSAGFFSTHRDSAMGTGVASRRGRGKHQRQSTRSEHREKKRQSTITNASRSSTHAPCFKAGSNVAGSGGGPQKTRLGEKLHVEIDKPMDFRAFERHIQSHIDHKVVSRCKAQKGQHEEDEFLHEKLRTAAEVNRNVLRQKKKDHTGTVKAVFGERKRNYVARRSKSLDDADLGKILVQKSDKKPWMIAAERYSNEDVTVSGGTRGNDKRKQKPSSLHNCVTYSSAGSKRASHYEVDVGPPNPFNLSKYPGNRSHKKRMEEARGRGTWITDDIRRLYKKGDLPFAPGGRFKNLLNQDEKEMRATETRFGGIRRPDGHGLVQDPGTVGNEHFSLIGVEKHKPQKIAIGAEATIINDSCIYKSTAGVLNNNAKQDKQPGGVEMMIDRVKKTSGKAASSVNALLHAPLYPPSGSPETTRPVIGRPSPPQARKFTTIARKGKRDSVSALRTVLDSPYKPQKEHFV